MTPKTDFRKIKKDFLSPDILVREKASRLLVKEPNDKVFNFLVIQLKNNNPLIRNLSACTLAKIGDNRAVGPIFDAINKPDNRDYRGSLVYALLRLDCSRRFLDIIGLCLYGNYEVQNHALKILKVQKFVVAEIDLFRADRMIDDYLGRNDRCEDWALLVKEIRKRINCYRLRVH